jgi:hypothetical protein
MPERRYSRYKQEDVWVQMVLHQEELHIQVLPGTVHGNSVSIHRLSKDRNITKSDTKATLEKPADEDNSAETNKVQNQEYRAVVLARSSDWYYYSLNCTYRFKHGITCVVAGTHDSCINRPVLAMDVMRWYEPKKIRNDFGLLQPMLDTEGKVIPDLFEEKRRTQYGHNILIGALLQRRADAFARLATFKDSTRWRIEAEMRKLEKRRVGRPISVWPVERIS